MVTMMVLITSITMMTVKRLVSVLTMMLRMLATRT